MPGRASGAATLALYYRDGCHFCEALAALLYRGWPQQAECLEWRDVDGNPLWREQFGSRVPVLVIDDQVVCAAEPDPAMLSRYFGKPVVPI